MILRNTLLALVAFLIASCGQIGEDDPSPILYEVSTPEGGVEGWLFGTIHALPDGTEWRTETLNTVLVEADTLIVEIADLEDAEYLAKTFAQLSRSDGLPDIGNRVEPDYRPALFTMIDKAGFSPSDFATLETWAVALTLAQVNATGDPDNGVDRALIQDFHKGSISEFEGAAVQLAIFDQLPEAEQQDLLEGVLEESKAEDPTRLRDAWLAGDVDVLEEATRTGIMADPELREAILTGRNNAWLDQLLVVLKQDEKPLVAVGTAHLLGPDGLPKLLESRGYTVKRIQ